MSIFKRGEIYWCKWKINGREIRETTGTENHEQAQEYHDRRRAELWRITKLGDASIESWDEAAFQWVDEHAQHKKSYEDDRLRLIWLTKKLSGKPVTSITTDEILKIRKTLLETRAPATANRFLAVISAVLNYAHSKGKLDGVPKIPYMPENNERFLYLTQEQANRLIEELPHHLAMMTRFALATGLRRANITGLEWGNVNMERKIAWVWADDAKGKRHIPVPLNSDALEVLSVQMGTNKGTHVFTYKDIPVTRTTTAAWKKAIARAGIDPAFSFHCLRHTWASWHVMAGTPLSVLQTLGGWRSLDMVQRYAHLAPDFIATYAKNSEICGVQKKAQQTSKHLKLIASA